MADAKRVVKPKKTLKSHVPKAEARKSMTARKREQAQRMSELELPTEPKAAVNDIRRYSILLYGREKIGKTSTFAGFPDALFLTTEPGTKGLEIFEFNADGGGITSWKVMRRVVDLLEREPGRFSNVIIDTAARAYDMCLDHVCAELGIDYPGTTAQGVQDRGRSWNQVEREFVDTIQRLMRTGRGVHFTCHARESVIETRGGAAFTRIEPKLSGQAGKVVKALVDFIFFVDYLRDDSGRVIRVLITEGDDLVTAGQRRTTSKHLPRFIALPEGQPEKNYETLCRAFAGEELGLDPATLRVAGATSAATEKLVTGERTRSLKKRVKKGG